LRRSAGQASRSLSAALAAHGRDTWGADTIGRLARHRDVLALPAEMPLTPGTLNPEKVLLSLGKWGVKLFSHHHGPHRPVAVGRLADNVRCDAFVEETRQTRSPVPPTRPGNGAFLCQPLSYIRRRRIGRYQKGYGVPLHLKSYRSTRSGDTRTALERAPQPRQGGTACTAQGTAYRGRKL
jgi:hypothetical protein